MTFQRRAFASAAAFAVLAVVARAQYGTNLVVNGDAESGTGASSNHVVAAPGWTTTGSATVIVYGAPGGFPTAADPGPANRGLNFFAGGADASTSLGQTIDLASLATGIDHGATYSLAAFLGGYGSQNDRATLTVDFRSASGDVLGTAGLGPVFAVDRGNSTGLLARSSTGAVPVGTRSASVLLTFERVFTGDNDGYADNVSLSVDPVPEPTTVVALGLGALGVIRRRRKR